MRFLTFLSPVIKKIIVIILVIFLPALYLPPGVSGEKLSRQKVFADFLNMVKKDSFNYFWSLYDDTLGLIPDSSRAGSPCSIAAVGFGLTAFCIGVENGWVDKNEAYLRIYKTLKTFLDVLENQNGFFFTL